MRRSAPTRSRCGAQIREAVAEATRRGKLRPNSVDSITGRELRQQPRTRHANRALRAVGARRHRGEADPEGRRLREHERAVLAADRAGAPRARRPIARRRPQVHPARGVAGAGQGVRARRRRRLHRRRPDVRLLARQGAALSRPWTMSTPISGWRRSSRTSWRPSTASASDRWASAAGPRSSAARSARSTVCPPASSSRSPTTAGRSAASA